MKPDFPEDPASVVWSQRRAWIAELEVLSRDPRVRKFAELRQKIEIADAWYRLGAPGQGGIGGKQKRLGSSGNKMFAFKKGDLEGLVNRNPPTRSRGDIGEVLKELLAQSFAPGIGWRPFW